MGNAIEANKSCEKPVAVVNPMPAANHGDDSAADEDLDASNCGGSIGLQLFHYRQQIGWKKHRVIKWATSKLMLTEQLLLQPQPQEAQQPELPPLSEDAAWAELQLAMLTDDEDDDADAENRAPGQAELGKERTKLLMYRSKLRNTIVELAQEKMRKRKTKVKRLKRRTLISSKKPSNKDKHRRSQY